MSLGSSFFGVVVVFDGEGLRPKEGREAGLEGWRKGRVFFFLCGGR